MSDLEMTRLCAQAMGYASLNDKLLYEDEEGSVRSYTPLHDDAQAMQLVKRFGLDVDNEGTRWMVVDRNGQEAYAANADLNRAIVECVAKLQSSKEPR